VHYTTSCNTQSSAPEDGRDHRPKHAELIGIINKPLLLHLVGFYIIYVNDARSNKYHKYNYNCTSFPELSLVWNTNTQLVLVFSFNSYWQWITFEFLQL
jgi:hypothetical protein